MNIIEKIEEAKAEASARLAEERDNEYAQWLKGCLNAYDVALRFIHEAIDKGEVVIPPYPIGTKLWGVTDDYNARDGTRLNKVYEWEYPLVYWDTKNSYLTESEAQSECDRRNGAKP